MPHPPFGKETRALALRQYFASRGRPTAEDAWEHVYRLLLSVDRRTQLAHVYDGNHMQEGGNFHARAVRFTDSLCRIWRVDRRELPGQIDVMFRHCVDEFERQRASRSMDSDDEGDGSDFLVEIAALLRHELALQPSDEVLRVVREIERKAERYFTIEKKRQNVRGEGFEDVLEYLLREVSGVPVDRLRVRARADELPGFRRPLATKEREKVPKPDIVLVSEGSGVTQWLVTVKWSLRQDRLDQFAQEASYYQANREQTYVPEFVLVTNEMDVARLRDVLQPGPHGGGFYFNRVYHVSAGLLAETHGPKLLPLEVYRADGRLLSLDRFLRDAANRAGSGR